MIKFVVTHQQLDVAIPLVVGGSVNYLEADFKFLTPDWDGCARIAKFGKGSDNYEFILVDGKIPAEAGLNLSAGMWEVSLVGIVYDADGNEAQRITTNAVSFRVMPTGAGITSEIEQSVAEQLAAMIAALQADYDIILGSEELRRQTENERALAEDERQAAEIERDSAEFTRQENEGTRLENEEARITAENERIAAENERQTAEAERETYAQELKTAVETQTNAAYEYMESSRLSANTAAQAATDAGAYSASASNSATEAKRQAVSAAEQAGNAAGSAAIAQEAAERAVATVDGIFYRGEDGYIYQRS